MIRRKDERRMKPKKKRRVMNDLWIVAWQGPRGEWLFVSRCGGFSTSKIDKARRFIRLKDARRRAKQTFDGKPMLLTDFQPKV